ncbi:PREDICTED: phosphatidylinositide phosphatase SAC2-like [Amphimedon queenslandica]|uniref:SAC domain-containing protein n=1 Tax=Amphimedon queenslandica TaxID=400682 RepID=A0A1X7TZJ7_AMPQE|nr:PREDICTED: phosphatidylinositide phosphatase SAC2-like [Amphimedon queenslandica]|eukprot:XP_019856838.1 PREDICTED: phosphatidylinositide phosphatase SAC2-like [Amphimedon queenslandica]
MATSPSLHLSHKSSRVDASNLLSIELDDMGSIDQQGLLPGGRGESADPNLEVWITKSHVMIMKRGESTVDTLWYSREDGSLLVGSSIDVQANSVPTKLCHSFGLIGKLQLLSNTGWYLLIITEAKSIGRLPNTDSDVFCIERVALISLSAEKSIDEIKMETYAQDRREKDVKDIGKLEKKLKEALLQMFNGSRSFYFSYETDLTQSVQRKHDCGDANKLRKWERVDERFFWNKNMLQDLLDNDKTIDKWVLPVVQGYIEIKTIPIPSPDQLGIFLKKQQSHDTHVTTFLLGTPPKEGMATASVDVEERGGEEIKRNDRKDEHDIYSSTPLAASLPNELNDTLTQSNQHQLDQSITDTQSDLISFHTDSKSSQSDLKSSQIDPKSDSESSQAFVMVPNISSDVPTVTMALISRRSRHRAGTRYLRRGVDNEGHVANFVETEMLLLAATHLLSFIVVRGSVPVYWTQPGNRYRPLPIIEQTDEETAVAFERHFESQMNLYREQVIVNLINQSGRERIVSTAFEKQLLTLDCPSLTYVAFDFHHHCKVNQWHNINLLLSNIEQYITRQKYFWIDNDEGSSGQPLCYQNGVFRVNCMDCLDRTNVVQSVICKEFIQTALQKLGLIDPFTSLTGQFLRHYQELWANNGDTISRQYTGTDAMKGDLTRYGQRRLYGVMKDGYNSAHRYLQSLFRDAYRQVVIDLQQGAPVQDALTTLSQSQKGISEDEQGLRQRSYSDLPPWSSEREQLIADMIKTCRDNLFPNTSVPVKGWALIEPAGYSFVPTSEGEEDAVLLLCKERRHICVANYNNEFEQVACCIRIPLDRIERISIGPIGSILKTSRRVYMRLFYTLFPGCSCYFTFRPIHSISLEEDKLTLLSLSQELVEVQPTITLQEQRLTKKASKFHEGIVYLISPSEWAADGWENVLIPVKETRETAPDKGGSIFYDNVSSSSSASVRLSIPSPNEEEKGGEGERVSSQSSITDDDNDESFSAPASPSKSRESKITTLQERSRLFSHGSAEDLPSRVIQDDSGKGERRRHKRRESIGYVILASASSSIDQNESSPDQLIQIDDFQFRERVPSPRSPSSPPNNTKPPGPTTTISPTISPIPTSTTSPSSFSPTFSPSFSTAFSYNATTGSLPEKTLPPSLSPVEAITLSAPVCVTDFEPLEGNTAPSTAANTGGTGKRFSRWKAKLFKQSQQQEARYEEEEELEEKQSDSRFYVDNVEEEKEEVVAGGRGRLARSILRGIKTSSSSLTREKVDNVEIIDEEKQLMISAMAASRTKFIII